MQNLDLSCIFYSYEGEWCFVIDWNNFIPEVKFQIEVEVIHKLKAYAYNKRNHAPGSSKQCFFSVKGLYPTTPADKISLIICNITYKV